MSDEVAKKRFKREGGAGWVGISKKPEPRFDYPVPCIGDFIAVKETYWSTSLSTTLEYEVGICYVYGTTTELILCKKISGNGMSFDTAFRKKEFRRGGYLFGPVKEEVKNRLQTAVSI